MTKIIQITDVHMVPPRQALFDTDPAVRLRQCLRDIRATQQDVAWLIFTGDLAHRGEPEAYALLRQILEEETDIPVRLMLGNHDDRAAFRSVFPEQPVDPQGFVQSVIDLPAARLVCLDTLAEGSHGGALCEARLGWLRARIAEAGDRPLHLFLHHPPFEIGMAGVDGIRLKDEAALAAALDGGRVAQLYFGHVHRPVAGNWRGRPISMSYGLNHQAALNLDGARRRGRIGPAEYTVILLKEDRTIVHFHDFLYAYPEIVTPGMDG